ncbi:MAG: hypothetical protein R3C97_13130 [Geminicoccaceae bacterium]
MSNSLSTERLNKDDDRAQFRAFLADEETRSVVDQVIRDLVILHASTRVVSGTASNSWSEHRSPRILLVDLTQSDPPLSDINAISPRSANRV